MKSENCLPIYDNFLINKNISSYLLHKKPIEIKLVH